MGNINATGATYLYFCDGKACERTEDNVLGCLEDPPYCFLTSKIEHSTSRQNGKNPQFVCIDDDRMLYFETTDCSSVNKSPDDSLTRS